jgi:chromosome segregation ATPase
MADKTDNGLIFDLLKEVREDQKEQGKELAKQSGYLVSMDSDVKELKQTVSVNTKDIAHHIARTDGLQTLHEDNKKRIDQADQMIAMMNNRIDKLEEPKKALAWVKAHLVTIASVLTAILSLIALVATLKGLK